VSDRKKIGLALFSRNDLSAFWALFADNVANLMLIMTVCSLVFKMPSEVVFGHIVPGLGVALLMGLLAYAHLAHRLSTREGRIDVTALPYGISTPIMFVFLFGIMGPVYWKSSDALLAWRVGIAAAFIGGIIEIVGSALGPWLKRHLPRAGMLGTLAGIALTFIAAVPLAEIFEHPLIGLPATVVVLIGLVALVRLPGGIPAGLLAILLGVAIGLTTGEANFTTEGIGFFPPVPVFTDLWLGLKALFNNPWIFALVIPAEIYNFIETMNNVESAEAAGDTYPVRTCQVLDGAGTLLGALFGSAFPTTVYIGHPGYKRLGGRAGYTWAVGVILFLSAVFGFLAVLHHLVPMAAVAPILLFVGLVITAQAFQASPRAHALAVAFGMLPHLSNLVVIKWDALRLNTRE
jgi:AGZA family xanthine/uracil permease-like MFS transporter